MLLLCHKVNLACMHHNYTKLTSSATLAGQGETNNGSNYTGSTNDMQDVNSPLQDPSRTSGKFRNRTTAFRWACLGVDHPSNDELARTQAHLQAVGIANERTPSER